MGFSSLVNGVTLSQFKSSREGTKIDSVAIHTMASNGTAEGCGYWFTDDRAKASSNYGVDGKGIIWGYVDESERAWCTSSWGVDSRSITIEVASTTNDEPYACTQEAYNALIKLLVDICSRYGMTLRWKADEAYALKAAEGGPVTEQNMFAHRWFNRVKSCPGQYLFERFGQIAKDVNAKLNTQSLTGPAITTSPTTPTKPSATSSNSSSSSSTSSSNTQSFYAPAVTKPTTQSTPSQTVQPEATKVNLGNKKIIFVGDTRFSGIQSSIGTNPHIWSCSSSASYEWLTTQGVPNIESKIAEGYSVCITVGPVAAFNKAASGYSDYINECADRWKDKNVPIYFVSINPIGKTRDDTYSGVSNYMIAEYNQKIRDGLKSNVGYIDTYSSLINSYSTKDGLNYDKNLSIALYHLISGAIDSDEPTLVAEPAVIGGDIVQVDYMQLNPYIVTLNRDSSSSIQYSQLRSEGVVGVIIEGGYLYDAWHNVVSFRQPKFKQQLAAVQSCNLDYGFYFTIRSRTLAEARSEMKEITMLTRAFPCKLGIWLKLEFSSGSISTNNAILDYFQKQLILLGFVAKIGLYIENRMLDTFTWSKYSDVWLLWIIDHVQSESDIRKILDASFFRTGGA